MGLSMGAAAQDQTAVTDAMARYIEAREEGRIDNAYRMIAPSFKEYLPQPDFQKMLTQRRLQLGKLEGFEIMRSTDYPGDPVKVALDYFASYESGALECGYYIWSNEPGLSPQLIRIEHNVVRPKIAKTNNWPDLMAQMGCKVIPQLGATDD